MKVYVATTGEYSDYCINGIFTTRELAEAYLTIHNGWFGYEAGNVEEWEVTDESTLKVEEAEEYHPWTLIYLRDNDSAAKWEYLKTVLRKRERNTFEWFKDAPDKKLYGFDVHGDFYIYIQVDKYDYDYDRIMKVVYDTKVKLMSEKLGL